MANVKTIVVDLDKTLLHTDKTLSEYTVGVLKECKRQAIKIMVATATPLRTAMQCCEMIDYDATYENTKRYDAIFEKMKDKF